MKIVQSVLLVTFMLLSINTISAQFGNNGYGGGARNGYGNGRMDSGMQTRNQEKPKEIPVEVTVAKIMEQLEPKLILDELQVIAISNILNETIRTQGMLIKAEVSQEDKIKNIQALSETTDRRITELLNKEQKDKYIAYNEELKNPKKSKSKKKSN